VFGIFAALAEFERDLISERTKAGLASARARGRKGGAPFKMTAAKVRLAMAAMGQKETKVTDLCSELAITRQNALPACRARWDAAQGWAEGN
jgi:DNA invertase Pin-like site-specific DNA recombinase